METLNLPAPSSEGFHQTNTSTHRPTSPSSEGYHQTSTNTNRPTSPAKEMSRVLHEEDAASDPNDLHMIDLCKDIMIHERDKNSAYTRVLNEQIAFLKSELQRKQGTIETLLSFLVQKDLATDGGDGDGGGNGGNGDWNDMIQRMIEKENVRPVGRKSDPKTEKDVENSHEKECEVKAGIMKNREREPPRASDDDTGSKTFDHKDAPSKDTKDVHKNSTQKDDNGVSTRMEYFDSTGSSVLKTRRSDGSAVGEKKRGGIARFERYGYKLINTDIGHF